MNKRNYTSPAVSVEEYQIENGIAVSTQVFETSLFNDIYLTEETVTWDE